MKKEEILLQEYELELRRQRMLQRIWETPSPSSIVEFALQQGVINNQYELVAYLINLYHPRFSSIVLYRAVTSQDLELFTLLYQEVLTNHIIRVDMSDILHHAIEVDNRPVVRFLIMIAHVIPSDQDVSTVVREDDREWINLFLSHGTIQTIITALRVSILLSKHSLMKTLLENHAPAINVYMNQLEYEPLVDQQFQLRNINIKAAILYTIRFHQKKTMMILTRYVTFDPVFENDVTTEVYRTDDIDLFLAFYSRPDKQRIRTYDSHQLREVQTRVHAIRPNGTIDIYLTNYVEQRSSIEEQAEQAINQKLYYDVANRVRSFGKRMTSTRSRTSTRSTKL